MTKEITKSIILQEIQDKFKLREFDPAAFLFDETVVPVYEIGEHLKTWRVYNHSESITSTGDKLFFTVPPNERWTLRSYMVLFYSEGAYQVSGVYLAYRDALSDYIYLDLKKNQASSYLVNLPVPVVLEPNNRIYAYIDTYVSTANLRLYVDVQKEEIR